MSITTEENELIDILCLQNNATRTDIMERLVKLGIQHLKENVPELEEK